MWNGDVDNYGDSVGQKSLFNYCKIHFGAFWSVKEFIVNVSYWKTSIVWMWEILIRVKRARLDLVLIVTTVHFHLWIHKLSIYEVPQYLNWTGMHTSYLSRTPRTLSVENFLVMWRNLRLEMWSCGDVEIVQCTCGGWRWWDMEMRSLSCYLCRVKYMDDMIYHEICFDAVYTDL